MGIKRNDLVEQILPAPIRGVVSGFSTCNEEGKSFVHVTTADGQEVVLPRDEVQAVEAPGEEG